MNKPMNVYPQINFINYLKELYRKHILWIVAFSLILGLGLFLLSFIQVYTSSTIFRFQVSETRNSSHVPSLQLEGFMGKTETVRDKSFNYVHSIPFYFELAKRFSAEPEGQKILPIFSRSRGNLLLKVKSFFFDTFTYGSDMNKDLQLAQSLQKVFSFKKDSDNTLIMYVRTGKADLSLKLGQIVAPIVRDIILDNESHDVNVSAIHFKELLTESQANLLRLENELLKHKQIQFSDKISEHAPTAKFELEKEVRMAKIEVQRYELLIRNLGKQINENSTYSVNGGNYRYVDQVSIERLTELKQQKELAIAKVISLEKSFEKLKQENKSLPVSEQINLNLKAQYELEYSINKDLVLKNRDVEGLSKLLDNSIRLIGETSLVPAKIKISRPLRFILGLILGSLVSMLGLYYFFDFFKVIKGNRDVLEFGNFEILNSVPKVKKTVKNFDLWQDLPGNHHAIEAFRCIMGKVEAARIVSFLSAGKREGKSFIIANLAENFTRFGKRVLIVDTNWANPTLSKLFANNSKIKVVDAESFRHDKHSFLDRSLLIKLIKTHSQNCDVILIDTQNLSSCNDGLVAASISTLNIVVCSQLETYQHKFYNLVKKIEVSDLENVSVVLNKASIDNELMFLKGQIKALDEIDTNTIYMKKSS